MKKKFKIKNLNIGDDYNPFVIAEMSANHGGDIKNVFKTIDSAKKTGANALKIQTYTADSMTLNINKPNFKINKGLWSGHKLYDLYKEAHTPLDWHKDIFDYAKKIKFIIFSSVFNIENVSLLEKLNCPAYKIASFEINDHELIGEVAKTGKPIIISTGMSNLKEIREAVFTAKKNGCKNLALLYCVSGYPTPIEEINLKSISFLKKEFDLNIGLSDHTIGTKAAELAVCLGANIIEKHFTISKKIKSADSSFSATPKEFTNLVLKVKEAKKYIGKEFLFIKKSEKSNIMFRRSLYFTNNLTKGSKITKNDVKKLRPGYGLSPKFIKKVIGKKVSKNIKIGDPVKIKDIF